MQRTTLSLTVLLLMLVGVAQAEELSIDPPAGTELWKSLHAKVDDDRGASLFLFADAQGTLSGVAVSSKNGAERSRKNLDLGGATKEDTERVLLEDIDMDEHLEAMVFRRAGSELKLMAWEWIGNSIFTEPEAGGWLSALGGSTSDDAFVALRNSINERKRQDHEKTVIGEAVESLVPEIKACSEKAIIKYGLANVEVVISFAVDPKGAVKDTSLVSSNLQHKPSEKCVAGVVARLDFKGEVQGPIQIEYPIEFSGT